MKPTMEILARISQNSSKNKEEVFTRLYRYLLRPDIYYEAYRNLYANSGAATKGVNEDTADGFRLLLLLLLIQYALVGETSVKAEFVNNSSKDTYKVEIRRNKDNTLLADPFEIDAGKSVVSLTLLEAPAFGNRLHCSCYSIP